MPYSTKAFITKILMYICSVYLGYQRYEEVDIQVGFSLINNRKIVGIDIDLNK
ncbi:MAG: hypothetical protein ACLSA2_02125 [Candidatus Gastranaerophilaceae bacterium]